MDSLHQNVLAAAGKAAATIRASQAVATLTAAQIRQERAGQPTSGPGATLVGTGEVINP